MHTPMLQESHDNRPGPAEPPRSGPSERARLLEEIDRQRVEPGPSETLAMAMIVLVFVGAVLAFALAATKII